MKRGTPVGLLLMAMVALSAVTGCQTLFAPALKVPTGCKAKAGTVAEPYTKTGWAKEIIHEQTGIELVYIPAGTFMMGSPADEPGRSDDEVQHRVTISNGFYMGKYPVTQEQWLVTVMTTPSEINGGSLPVETVTWNGCMKFCRSADLRLPTEAEWEYACRAGNRGQNEAGKLGEMRWQDGRKHPVGLKRPNAWGLCDMHGNVFEWCSDWYGPYSPEDATDPAGPASGYNRVYRGGSPVVGSRPCRAAFRGHLGPACGFNSLGFRVVLPAVQ